MTPEPRQAREPAPAAEAENVFITQRLRMAGMFIIAGVLVEGLSLVWNHPLSFLAFIGVGGLVTFLGVVIYLVALVSPQRP